MALLIAEALRIDLAKKRCIGAGQLDLSGAGERVEERDTKRLLLQCLSVRLEVFLQRSQLLLGVRAAKSLSRHSAPLRFPK
ncbi:MAG: hypothetical protein HOP13_03195 [Alphaproteobacteria bacterium]|nr:hypothetical protein [Alphaproteobacteria bacterium]